MKCKHCGQEYDKEMDDEEMGQGPALVIGVGETEEDGEESDEVDPDVLELAKMIAKIRKDK